MIYLIDMLFEVKDTDSHIYVANKMAVVGASEWSLSKFFLFY